MRIVIDLQGAQAASRSRGIGRHSLSLALAIARQRGEHEIILALNGLFVETIEPIRGAFDGLLPQHNIRVWQAPAGVAFRGGNDGLRGAAELVREAFLASLRPDVVHVMSHFEGFADDAVTSIGRFADIPTTVILYDLIPHINRDNHLTDPQVRDWYYGKFDQLRRASLLLALSESSRKEGIDHLAFRPTDIITVSCAADSRFKPIRVDPAVKSDLFRRHGITRPFVMYSGGDGHRKNLEALIRVFAGLPETVRRKRQLVIVSSLEQQRQKALRSLALELGLAFNDVIMTDYVPDDELINFYNACTLFIFPSWHEGFGLPMLEAMSCGAPVIGADTSSGPDVIGRNDALFDPHSDQSMRAKLLQALTDHDFRADLARHGLERSKAFSWDFSAQRAIAAFERLHNSRQNVAPVSTPNGRPCLAYVSPVPPSAELLDELSRNYDITLITSDQHANENFSPPRHGPEWLRANADRFERVLYRFANSPLHDFMTDLLMEVPGVVILDDFFIGEALHGDKRKWTRALYESHGYSAVLKRFRAEDTAAIVSKYPANLGLLQSAYGVIVPTDASRRLANQWYGADVGEDWAVARAGSYTEAIERFYERSRADVPALVQAIAAQNSAPNDFECERLAASIAANHPAQRSARRLFMDVSELIERDARSGIQRVTRSVLGVLLAHPPEGFRIEPVYATPKSAGYRYGRRFTLNMMGCPADWIEDEPIDAQIGDIFLGLDLNQEVTVRQARVLDAYRAVGVRVYHVIHDLLPVLRPDCFSSEVHESHSRWLGTITRFDGVITVSRAVAEELLAWLAVHGAERLRPLHIAWCHHGADIEMSVPTSGMPSDAREVLDRLQSTPTFLIVGTLEPRKGHAQALSAFESLWSAGLGVNLVLVGKRGWMVDGLVKRLQRHSELGRRLFWLDGISDEYLEKVYAASTCLLASSEAEGFGLPLIEAARHGLPILARDISVFREVAGEHAVYFSGLRPDDLAKAVREWLVLFRAGRHPRTDAMPRLTWQQSTQNLLDVILGNKWAMTWPQAGPSQ